MQYDYRMGTHNILSWVRQAPASRNLRDEQDGRFCSSSCTCGHLHWYKAEHDQAWQADTSLHFIQQLLEFTDKALMHTISGHFSQHILTEKFPCV